MSNVGQTDRVATKSAQIARRVTDQFRGPFLRLRVALDADVLRTRLSASPPAVQWQTMKPSSSAVRQAVGELACREKSKRRHGRSHTAGSDFDISPYVCETTNPLACDV